MSKEKLKSVGKPFPNFEVKLEDSEIMIKSDALMLGYYKDEEETAKVLQALYSRVGLKAEK